MSWLRDYDRSALTSVAFAALIVTLMLVPQSLAYAMLAGLPPQIGLYASIASLIAYAVFGSSRTLCVGPVAVVSLMTAAAAGKIAESGSANYIQAALVLALLSAVVLGTSREYPPRRAHVRSRPRARSTEAIGILAAPYWACVSKSAPGDVHARSREHRSR